MTREEFEAKYLRSMNPQQREAVLAVDGNILLLATPGSGKTTVLVTRLGYMVLCQGIDPRSILTMTYTKAATMDMRSRFGLLFGENAAAQMQFRTINGVSAKIIEFVGTRSGKTPFSLQENEGELNKIIRQIYQEVNEEYPEDSVVKEIRTLITYIKNMMLTEEEIQKLDTDVDRLQDIYQRYQLTLRNMYQMDYDDQMIYALNMLRRFPEVLDHFQNLYRYICVDEAQDTSKIQHEIIKLLAAKNGNLFMVGDEDQSIYGFRAAYPEALLNFEIDHPGAKVLLMEENYRSTQEIVDVANCFVSQNAFRHEKTIRATRPSGEPVHLIRAKNREAQYRYLTEMARSCCSETAILFRNNDSALPLIDIFEKEGISYNCRNVDDIFFSHRIVVDVLDILSFSYDPQNADIFMRIYYKFGAAISKQAATDAVQRSQRSGKPIVQELMYVPGIRGTTRDVVIDLVDTLPLISKDNAETAIHRIWEIMHYGRYVEQKKLDKGKFFILCMLAKDVPDAKSLMEKLSRLRSVISGHRNSEANKVVLSTIHSSKGLEYQRVFLLDMLDGVIPSKKEADIQNADEVKQYEEERRLFYVAMTRAKDELYCFHTAESSDFVQEISSYLPLQKANENDVFAPLSSSLLGKVFFDRERGKGEIIAQCEDTCLISFSTGGIIVMRLDEMIARRDTSILQTKNAPSEIKQKRRMREPWAKIERGAMEAALKVGSDVYHKAFGFGKIKAIDGDIVTIAFEEKGTKRLSLETSLTNGALMPAGR